MPPSCFITSPLPPPYYYSGLLYADPDYEANVGYLMVSYGF